MGPKVVGLTFVQVTSAIISRIKTMMDYLEELADTPTLSEDMGDIETILMEEL